MGDCGIRLVAFIFSVSMTEEEVTYVSFWYQNASVQGSHWSRLGIPPSHQNQAFYRVMRNERKDNSEQQRWTLKWPLSSWIK